MCDSAPGNGEPSGTAAADASYQYTVGTDLDDIPGAVMKTTVTRPSGTDAGNLVTETYSAVGGLTLAVKTNSVTTATYAYDTLARPILSTDGDGVKSHTAYNAKGEAYRRAASRDGSGTQYLRPHETVYCPLVLRPRAQGGAQAKGARECSARPDQAIGFALISP